jgi:putative salt-induced outer membrane protein YdiY
MMWKILCALLVGAAIARADDTSRAPETTEDAVRAVLDATTDIEFAQPHISEGLPRGYVSAAAETTSPWEITGALGFTLTDGNSDTIQLTVGAAAKREWPKWKLGMKLAILYGETDGEQTSSEWIFFERLERKLSERATIFQDLLLEHDEEEDLGARIQFTVGYNRRLVLKEKFELWGNVGGGVLHEEFFDDAETEGIAQAGINFTWQITKQLKYTQVITFYPSLSEGGEFRMYWESVFTTPISDRFDLRLMILDRYDSNPQPGIEENDLTIAIALAVKFTKPPPPPPG